MPLPLLASRLVPPPLPEYNLPRPSLMAKMRSDKNLIVLEAAAGFGKTTLLSQWHHEQPLAYLNLDRRDNRPARLLRYCMGALNKQNHPSQSLALLENGEPPENVLEYWLEELEALPTTHCLALDNLQVLEDSACLELLKQLIHYKPPHLQLILSGRQIPTELGIQRIQLRGQALHLSHKNLRFSVKETEAYATRRQHNLSPEIYNQLQQDSEGWPLALHFSLSQVPFKAIHGIAQRELTQFLHAEIWPELPESWQNFMLKSSVIEVFTPDLVQALMPEEQTQPTLQALLKANVFLNPLDQQNTSFRYHPMVRQWLYTQLTQHQPTERLALHQRAARYFAQNKDIPQALEQAQWAQNTELQALILSQQAQSLIQWGEIDLLHDALKQIPPAQHSPELVLAQAWVLSLRQELEAAEALINQFSPQSDFETAQLANIRGTIARRRGQAEDVLAYAETALSAAGQDTTIAASAWFNRGLAYLMLGQDKQALSALESAQNWNRQAGQAVTECAARGCIASIYLSQGQLQNAEKSYQQVLEQLDHYGLQQHSLGGKLRLEMARVAYEKNQIERFYELLETGLALTRRAYNTDFSIGYFLALKLLLDTRALEQSETLLDEAIKAVQQRTPQAAQRFLDIQDRLWIHQRKPLPASSQQRLEQEAKSNPYIAQSAIYSLLYQQHFEQALKQIDQALEQAKQDPVWRLRLFSQKAHCLFATKQEQACQEQLQQAIELAVGMGALRSLSDECGQATALLLRCVQKSPVPAAWHQALQQICAPEMSAERLSDRELEILTGLSQGLSNQALADQLIVSLNTIKTHLKNVYRKLEVSNRTQALAKARELGYLQ